MLLHLCLNLVADTPDYFQVARLFRIDLNLFADMADMYRNGIVCTDRFLVPDVLINLADGKDLAFNFL